MWIEIMVSNFHFLNLSDKLTIKLLFAVEDIVWIEMNRYRWTVEELGLKKHFKLFTKHVSCQIKIIIFRFAQNYREDYTKKIFNLFYTFFFFNKYKLQKNGATNTPRTNSSDVTVVVVVVIIFYCCYRVSVGVVIEHYHWKLINKLLNGWHLF